MQENEKRLEQLRIRLETLSRNQEYVAREIAEIRLAMAHLDAAPEPEPGPAAPFDIRPPETHGPGSESHEAAPTEPVPIVPPSFEPPVPPPVIGGSPNLEAFIGGNLISKIGVVILVIGVAIGAKYAIDQGWITPVMRVVLGYLIGIALLVPAYRLRVKMPDISAVTLSGAMAVFYFITYAAYSFYALLPQAGAFALMVFVTAFTVFAAIRYERVLIAHLGLVSAYAVPLLLSENEGRVAVLFSYTAIVNCGILAVSLARYWRSLFYSSFAVTWLIFFAWYTARYVPSEHFPIAFGFAALFFAIFYATFIAWKLFAREPFGPENIALVLANSFIFFGVGQELLAGNENWAAYPGLFALGNAAIHFAVAVAVYRAPRTPAPAINLFVGLVIAFLTIAVPLQLKGHWITLVWIAEAFALFSIGRVKRITLYEWFSYPLSALATLSLLVDWVKAGTLFHYGPGGPPYPVLNDGFVTNLFYLAGGALALLIGSRRAADAVIGESARPALRGIAGAAMTLVAFNTVRTEIGNFWDWREFSTKIVLPATGPDSRPATLFDPGIASWNALTQIDYALLFVAAAFWINRRFFRSQFGALSAVFFSGIFLLVFVTAGFAVLTELRDLYLRPLGTEFAEGAGALLVRYVSYACAGLLLAALGRSAYDRELPSVPIGPGRTVAYDLIAAAVALAVLSAELLNLTDIFAIRDSEKLGLSILWGLFALALVLFGIRTRRKHLRIASLVIFAATLAKLFLYDLAELGTISKTVVFVALGALMLVVAYLYNRFSETIFGKDEK
jgi:uncharacterized membrane protein